MRMVNSRFLSPRNLPSDRISLMMMSSRLSLSLSLDPLVSAFPESIIQTKHHINTICEKTQTILYLVKLRVIYQFLLSSFVPKPLVSKPPRPNPNPVEPSSKTKGIGAATKILWATSPPPTYFPIIPQKVKKERRKSDIFSAVPPSLRHYFGRSWNSDLIKTPTPSFDQCH